jgi:hypothetical protein
MSRFPRYLRRQLEAKDLANVDRATRDATDDGKTYKTTAAGDSRKLRGIPAIGRSVTGATCYTRPGYDYRTGRPLE